LHVFKDFFDDHYEINKVSAFSDAVILCTTFSLLVVSTSCFEYCLVLTKIHCT